MYSLTKNLFVFILFTFIFSNLNAQQISIIGSATPSNDFETDYDLTESSPGSGIWTIQIVLSSGKIKFRQDGNWATSWSGPNFPSGTASLNYTNHIMIAPPGTYDISFNTNTLDYSFILSTEGNIGIGTSNPTAKLDIVGNIQIKDGSEGMGKIMTSDSTGHASWQNLNAASLFGTDNSHANDCIEVKHQIDVGGNPMAMATSGSLVFVVSQTTNELTTMSVHPTAGFYKYSSIPIGPNAIDIEASGDHVFILKEDSIIVFDVSQWWLDPIQVGSLDLVEEHEQLVLSGDYIYLPNHISNELTIVDISTTTSPQIVSTFEVITAIEEVTKVGNYIYCHIYESSSVGMIDVSNPINPIYVDYFSYYNMGDKHIAVNGNYACYNENGNLKVLDVTDPSIHSVISSNSIPYTGNRFVFAGNIVFSYQKFYNMVSSGDIHILDFKDPHNPKVITPAFQGDLGFKISNNENSKISDMISIHNDYILVSDHTNGDIKLVGFCPQSTYIDTEGNLTNERARTKWDLIGNSLTNYNNYNVGIGTEKPMQKLDVVGNVQVSDSLFVDSFLEVGGDIDVGGELNVSNLAYFDGKVRIGITNDNDSRLLYISGSGRSATSNWVTSSDRRVKQNIRGLSNGSLDKILSLNPISYEWTPNYMKHNTGLSLHNTGFISQEVELVFPDMVEKVKERFGDELIEDFRLLNLSDLNPHFVKAFQEQQAIIDAQSDKIFELEREFSEVKQELHRLQLKSSELMEGLEKLKKE